MSDPKPDSVRAAILELTAARGPGKTICPTEAAKSVSPAHWRKLLPAVRVEAVRLAQSGDIMIYRKGQAVDPANFKGVYRLGLPAGRDRGDGGDAAELSTSRPSARLVIVCEQGRALLFRFRFPERAFWATPRGALSPTEDYLAAAQRELAEETGICAAVGPEFHRRETTFRDPDGNVVHAEERYFAVRVHSQELSRAGWEPAEHEVIERAAWLTPAEIRTLRDPVFPEDFASLVEAVLAGKDVAESA